MSNLMYSGQPFLEIGLVCKADIVGAARKLGDVYHTAIILQYVSYNISPKLLLCLVTNIEIIRSVRDIGRKVTELYCDY